MWTEKLSVVSLI